jgi:hypothetical protein
LLSSFAPAVAASVDWSAAAASVDWSGIAAITSTVMVRTGAGSEARIRNHPAATAP